MPVPALEPTRAPGTDSDSTTMPVLRRVDRGRRSRSPVPSIMAPAMPAGFQWIDATPVPKIRSGFVLVVILAMLGALLAMAVAALVIGIAVAIQGTVA